MYEFEIQNKVTNEEKILFGYNYIDACRKGNVEADEWKVIYREYVD